MSDEMQSQNCKQNATRTRSHIVFCKQLVWLSFDEVSLFFAFLLILFYILDALRFCHVVLLFALCALFIMRGRRVPINGTIFFLNFDFFIFVRNEEWLNINPTFHSWATGFTARIAYLFYSLFSALKMNIFAYGLCIKAKIQIEIPSILHSERINGLTVDWTMVHKWIVSSDYESRSGFDWTTWNIPWIFKFNNELLTLIFIAIIHNCFLGLVALNTLFTIKKTSTDGNFVLFFPSFWRVFNKTKKN